MARLTKTFDAFGVNYRTYQYSAVYGLDLMESSGDMTPFEIFLFTEAEYDGKWHKLDSRYAINAYVSDLAGILPPFTVMRALMGIVSEFNFGFLSSWKGVRVPGRFLDGATTVVSANSKPLVAQLQENGTASLKDLEEYYSLEDAFKLFDINVAKGVNDAIANEAAARMANKR